MNEGSVSPKIISIVDSSSSMLYKDGVKLNTKLSHDNTLDTVLQEIEDFYGLSPRADINAQSADVIDPDLADVLSYLDASCKDRRKENDKQITDLIRLRDRPDL